MNEIELKRSMLPQRQKYIQIDGENAKSQFGNRQEITGSIEEI